jgi:dihydroxyacetone kinase
MSLDRAARERLVRALAASMIEHAEELTSLDQAIGDGDHGLNMKRGFEAVLATLPGLADKSLPEMLKAIGMTLVMKVGGASGPLVGTFFMELGKALPEQPARADLVAAADKAIDAVKRAGVRTRGRKPCWMFWCRCKPYLRAAVTPGRLRPRRRKPPIARHRCLRPAAGHPSSAKDPSVIWTRGLARRPS